MNARNLFKVLAVVLMASVIGTLGFSSGAMARKVCADGSYPPCNTEGETATNNLSVPLWVTSDGSVISTPGGATCSANSTPTDLVPPTGTPISGYPIDPLAYYYVQGIHKWQAPCATWDQANGQVEVTAAWGDNLSGDAKLKVGSPIRVELVLTENSTVTRQGFTVVKLEPAALDRESSYGILATDDGLGSFSATESHRPGKPAQGLVTDIGTESFSATPTDFVPLVYDSQAWLTIVGNDVVVVDEAATAEINATGKVVYGYNLRVPSAGTYEITYTVPNVNITAADAGICGGQECSLLITVTAGGGNGGGGGPRR
ncbi:MAG: hypothetical protein P9E88_02305 [Candidatus Competibacter sp.]|nr:hypothetical protein [Candidatus Competibacter sp.]